MDVKGKPFLVLYLTDWQKRMVKDFMGLDRDCWLIPTGVAPRHMYGFPTKEKVLIKRMYLTDWQMREMKAEVGEVCEFVELKKELDDVVRPQSLEDVVIGPRL